MTVDNLLDAGKVDLGTSDDSDSSSDSSVDGENECEFIHVKEGHAFVDWKKMEGHTIKPFLKRGYNRRAEYKLHNYTEKTTLEYFESMLPWNQITNIATLITARGQLLAMKSEWVVTRGDVIGFLAFKFSIIMYSTMKAKRRIYGLTNRYQLMSTLFLAGESRAIWLHLRSLF